MATPRPSHVHHLYDSGKDYSSPVTHNYVFEEQAEIPLVDFGLLCQGNEAEIQKLVMAAKEWGFLQLANHGVSRKLLNEIEEQAHHAFVLPLEAKTRVEPAALGSFYGYFPQSKGSFGKVPSCEAFRLPLNPLQREDMITRLWPEGSAAFSSTLKQYIAAVERILLQLLKNLASGIGLDPLHFTHDVSNDGIAAVLRMNFYPTSQSSTPTLGFGAHADPQLLTILHHNGVDGLQILKDDKWIAIKVRLGSFIVNVGDILQVMSNDLYTSVVHRVVMKSEQFRLSVVCGMSPHSQAIVRPAPELVTQQQPSQYRPFTLEEFFIRFASNAKGKSHLETFKISPGLT